jgi:hypothetical protein
VISGAIGALFLTRQGDSSGKVRMSSCRRQNELDAAVKEIGKTSPVFKATSPNLPTWTGCRTR